MPATDPNKVARRRRRHLLLGLIVVALAGLVRAGLPRHVAVEHYDEGVYASNRFFGVKQGMQYPDRDLYAPPLQPASLEAAQILTGTDGALVGVVFGVGTVLLAGWALFKWCSMSAGMAAALLLATSDLHVVYSRTLLTDVPAAFWMLAAVVLFERGIVKEEKALLIGAAATTAFAWWTKYSGWLPLAIATSGSVAWLIAHPTPRPTKRLLLALAILIGLAGLLWLPVLAGLRVPGGYAAVSANQSRYVVGLSGWFDSLREQLRNVGAYAGRGEPSLAQCGWCFACGACLLFARGVRRADDSPEAGLPLGAVTSRHLALGVLFLVGLAAVVIFGEFAFIAAGGCESLRRMLQAWRNRSQINAADASRTFWVWLVSAWYWGLLLATFMYTPYPRLLIPLVIPSVLLTAALIDAISASESATGSQAGTRRRSKRRALVGRVLLASASLGFLWAGLSERLLSAWEDRAGLERVADSIADELTAAHSEPFSIYVFAEPALFYHLRDQLPNVGPIGSLSFTNSPNPLPTYLAVGPHGADDLTSADELRTLAEKFEVVTIFRYRPSLLVRSNRPGADRFDEDNAVARVTLYRVKP